MYRQRRVPLGRRLRCSRVMRRRLQLVWPGRRGPPIWSVRASGTAVPIHAGGLAYQAGEFVHLEGPLQPFGPCDQEPLADIRGRPCGSAGLEPSILDRSYGPGHSRPNRADDVRRIEDRSISEVRRQHRRPHKARSQTRAPRTAADKVTRTGDGAAGPCAHSGPLNPESRSRTLAIPRHRDWRRVGECARDMVRGSGGVYHGPRPRCCLGLHLLTVRPGPAPTLMMRGPSPPFHVNFQVCPRLTLVTSAGRKHARQVPPSRRTLG